MSSDLALRLTAEMMWNGLLISAPLLGFTLLVGLVVSVAQVVTQVQEMSLAFIPKLLVAVVVLVTFGPWMLKRFAAYASGLIASIPQML